MPSTPKFGDFLKQRLQRAVWGLRFRHGRRDLSQTCPGARWTIRALFESLDLSDDGPADDENERTIRALFESLDLFDDGLANDDHELRKDDDEGEHWPGAQGNTRYKASCAFDGQDFAVLYGAI